MQYNGNILFSILAAPKRDFHYNSFIKETRCSLSLLVIAKDSFDKFVIEVERNPVPKIVRPNKKASGLCGQMQLYIVIIIGLSS